MKLLGPIRADVQRHVTLAVERLRLVLLRGDLRSSGRKKVEWIIAQLEGDGADFNGYIETLREVQSDDLLSRMSSEWIDRARDALFDAILVWQSYVREAAAQCEMFRRGVFV